MAGPGFGLSFRGRLKRELGHWVELGIIDTTAADKLRAHYKLEVTGAGGAIIAAYIFGVLLIGGGIISLVAYNWDGIPGAIKLLLVGGMMVAAHVMGFRYWKIRADRPRLGHGLAFLGTLLLGATIGVTAQVFNVSSDGGTGIGVWALGALVAAWLYDSGPTGALSLTLADFWAAGFADRHNDMAPFLGFGLAVLYLPLVWRLRSRLLFAAVIVGLAIPHGISVGVIGRAGDPVLLILLLAGVLAAWSLAVRSETGLRFAPIARVLGILTIAGTAYFLSFHDVADVMNERGEPLKLLVALAPVALGLAGVIAWGLAIQAHAWREHLVTSATVAGGLLLALVSLVPEPEVPLAIAANLTLAAIAAAAITGSVKNLERLPFWSGCVLAALTILSRFIEFDTELWLKGFGFILCGAAVLWVGVSFERRVKAKGASNAA
jgi:uncharacterized membrane protein